MILNRKAFVFDHPLEVNKMSTLYAYYTCLYNFDADVQRNKEKWTNPLFLRVIVRVTGTSVLK